MDLSDAIKEAYEYAPAGMVYYDTLQIDHDDLDSPILVVNSHKSLTTNDGTFLPVFFTFKLPEVVGGAVGQLEITIDGIPGSAKKAIRAIARTRTQITITYRQYLEGSDEADMELVPLDVVNIKETYTGLSAIATLPNLAEAYFPRKLMTKDVLPALVL